MVLRVNLENKQAIRVLLITEHVHCILTSKPKTACICNYMQVVEQVLRLTEALCTSARQFWI